MKAHVQLTPAQRDEVNKRIKLAYKAGFNDGCEQASLFHLTALHNLHDWQLKGLENELKEVLSIAIAAQKDPDMIDRMRLKMSDLGIEIQGRFQTEPREK
jgi:hypothetical protein